MKLPVKFLLTAGILALAAYFLFRGDDAPRQPEPITLDIPLAPAGNAAGDPPLPVAEEPVKPDTGTGGIVGLEAQQAPSASLPEAAHPAPGSPAPVEDDAAVSTEADVPSPAALPDSDTAQPTETTAVAETPAPIDTSAPAGPEFPDAAELEEGDEQAGPPEPEDESRITADADPLEEPEEPAEIWIEHEIRPGDTLARVFDQFELSATELARILGTSDETRRLADLRPGQVIRIRLGEDGSLEELVHERSSIVTLRVSAGEEGYASVLEELPVEIRVEQAAATIESSLFVDGQEAGLSDKVIMEMAELFNWDIDFARELQTGDRFAVIYESRYVNGEKYGDGAILAAEFVNKGRSFRALRYRDPTGQVEYYAPDGGSKKKAFIKNPIKYGRISSRFSKRRWHPVLKRWRSHKGVDYAASTGTPIKAAGKGKITFIGRQRGYGKVIFLQHGDRYTTVYGHMSGFAKGMKKGKTVGQGAIIGYVGQTGLATGPHLHYEFRVNGKHVDPLSHDMPKAIPLPQKYLADFQAHTRQLVQQLNLLAAPRVAEQD